MLKFILVVVIIAAILVSYIQGDANGYKRGREEVLGELKKAQSGAGFKAAWK